MDYKFIIILFVFFGFIVFFREFELMKSNINDKLDRIYMQIDNSSKHTLSKIQNEFSLNLNKMKTMNGDYIEQVRKMNDYGNQPITNMSNHYTDTDSKGNGIKFASLSDCKITKVENIASAKDSFYLSEDEHEKNNNFKVVLPSEPVSKPKQKHHFNLSPDLIDDENNHITTESISNEKKENECIKEYAFDDVEYNDSNENNSNDDVSVDLNDDKKSEHSSNYGSITYESKKNQKKNIEDDSVQRLTISNFLSKDMYTSDVLKKIAKDLSIPIWNKQGSTRRQLKKDELYDKIKIYLTENK